MATLVGPTEAEVRGGAYGRQVAWASVNTVWGFLKPREGISLYTDALLQLLLLSIQSGTWQILRPLSKYFRKEASGLGNYFNYGEIACLFLPGFFLNGKEVS